MTAVNDRVSNQVSVADDEVFAAHVGGKLSVESAVPVSSARDLSVAYTPGVAQVSRAIAEDASLAAEYTWANRLVAVVSDGSAVLGLGDVGPRASLPVMEGKSVLFREFAGLNSIPLVLDTRDTEAVVATLRALRPTFGAVNLEDVAAPRCFELEDRLIEELDCPVMHDDQHGTAVVTLAALRNACEVAGREWSSLRVVVAGAGAAGVACARILHASGVGEIVVTDSRGVVHQGREDLTPVKRDLATWTNPQGVIGGLDQALYGADVFVGVSGGSVPSEWLASMAPDPVIFALSNPDPEILPEHAGRYASVVATGRSDYPNQINNVLAFPGIFRGALDAGARRITDAMKLAAAEAIADVVKDELSPDKIVPSPLDPRVAPAVTTAVTNAVQQERPR